MWKLIGVAVTSMALISCGHPGSDEREEDGIVRQADASDSISVTPNACVPAVGSSMCTVTVNWTELENTTKTYQVVVRADDGPWQLIACVGPNGSTRSVTADWIVLHHDYRFALRKGAASCSVIDPLATEVASATASAVSAQVTASSQRVLTTGAASVTIDWLGAYRTYNMGTSSYVPSNNQVWVSVDYGPASLFACSNPGTSGSSVAPWIGVHTYRFSLNPTPNACGDASTQYPEVAAVTVQGVAHYLQATPDRCSVATGGTCATTLSYGTTATGVTPQVWENNGTTWTKLAHCPPTAAELSRTIPAGNTYKYEPHLPTSCGASRTSTTTAATASMSALSSFVVREGTSLKLNGQPYRAMGMNKPELFVLYLSTLVAPPPGQDAFIACNAPADEICCPSMPDGQCAGTPPVSSQCKAEHDMLDAANAGAQYLRIAGTSYNASVRGGTGEELKKFWLSPQSACQDLYQRKLDAMLNYAQSIGLKIVTNFAWNQDTYGALVGTFPGHAPEHLTDMLKQPTGLARRLLLRYAQDYTEGCVNLPAITELGLPAGCSRTVDLNGHKANPTLLALEIKVEEDLLADLDLQSRGETGCITGPCRFTTADLAAFSRSFAESVRGWDPNHLLASNTTTLKVSEAHLRAWPEWTASGSFQCLNAGDNLGDPKWCQDDPNMYDSSVEFLHPEPIDLIGVHAYNSGGSNMAAVPARDNMRYGLVGAYNAEIFRYYERAADRLARPLEVGEFGDFSDCDAQHPLPNCNLYPPSPRRPFSRAALKKITDLHAPLSAPWVWEQRYAPNGDAFDIKPGGNGGLDDEFIAFFGQGRGLLSATTASMNVSPPNSDFETDVDGNGIPDGWTPAMGIVGAGAPFNDKTVRLQVANGVIPVVWSPLVRFCFAPPGGARLYVSVAGRSDATNANLVVSTYDSSGSGTGTFSVFLPSDQVFKVVGNYFTLPANARQLEVALMAGSSGYAEYDDVNVSVIY